MLFTAVVVTPTQIINYVTLVSINASIACGFFVGSNMQHWTLKEYAKLVSNHLQIWSGGYNRGGGVSDFEATVSEFEKRWVLPLSSLDPYEGAPSCCREEGLFFESLSA